MKRKKIAILGALIVIVSMVLLMVPGTIYATDPVNPTYNITVVKTATGFDSGDFTFTLYRNGPSDTWINSDSDIIGSGGGSVTLSYTDNVIPGGLNERTFYVVESGTNGATGVTWSFSAGPTATDGVINDTTDTFTLSKWESKTQTVYFDDFKKAPEEEPKPEVGNITVVKRDPGGNLLAGAGFTVYFQASGNPAAPEGFTADSGMITFAGLPFDTYIVRETTAPAGFGLAPDQVVVLNGDNTAIVVNFVDDPITTTTTTTTTATVTPPPATVEVLGVTEELPFTGQSMWLYIIGAAMLALAGGLTFVLRAAKSKE